MDRPFVTENARERERLRSLVERLTDDELSFRIGVYWTIAVALAHLAFWDQRVIHLIRKWKNSGVVAPSPIDIDVTNEALLSLWNALPTRRAAELAIEAAEEIDRELEEAPDELIGKIKSLGENSKLYRSIHRRLHVDEIEKAINEKS